MEEMRLTTASYLVLGLVEMSGPVTPYELKAIASESVVNFWSLPHTQIYTQCDRLTESGFLEEKREEAGRRRRQFTITRLGRDALDAWREDGDYRPIEIRDLAMLKTFFGADPNRLAAEQVRIHSETLAKYERYRQTLADATNAAGGSDRELGPVRALEAGIGHEQEFVRYWEQFLEG